MNRFLLSLVPAVILSTNFLFAQTEQIQRCITDEHYEEYLHKHPEAATRMEAAMKTWFDNRNNPVLSKKGKVEKIPVVFHIIHEYGPENISKEQIEDQMRILNEDFRRMNADAANTRAVFQGVAVDSEIEFVLASKDPQGNCTEGIVRVYSPLTNEARDNVKAVSYWPSNKYLNVWVVKTIENFSGQDGTITLGYAQFPWDRPSEPTTDGIVLRADYTGSIGTAAGKGNNGRVATHEIGHYLGLLHTFQGGCSASGWAEPFEDTPPVIKATSGCPGDVNTCHTDFPNLIDQWENYMDYSNGSCQNMFTQEQKDYMHLMILNYRSELVSASNALATGISTGPGNCAPIADLGRARRTLCSGSSLSFTDISYNGTPTSRTWTFEGGTPATSSDANPTITYNTPGVYKVSLEVSNSNGSSTVVRDSLIYVVPSISTNGIPFSEPFESGSGNFPPSGWSTSTDGNKGWEYFTGAGSGSNNCVRIVNNNTTTDGSSIVMEMPAVDLMATNDPVLTFDLAYARINTTFLDRIRVFASIDCGVSWVMIYQRAGVQMETGVAGTSNFVPNANQWKTFQVLLNNYKGKRNLMLRFEFVSDQGGNVYLDNINVGSVTTIDGISPAASLAIYPNPADQTATLGFEAFQSGELDVRITDLSGRTVQQLPVRKVEQGVNEIDLDLSGLSEGMYLVEVVLNGHRTTEKLLVRH